MISDFIQSRLALARYKILEDGTYFGEIPRIKGAWANAKTLEKCRRELAEVVKDWDMIRCKK